MIRNSLNKLCVLLFLFIYASAIYAQLSLNPVGARAAGLANITTVETDIWSVVNNPGALGLYGSAGVGISYEQRFLMEELGLSSIATAFPVLGNMVGLSLSNLGFSTYGQDRFGLSIGRKLNNFISVGVGVDAHLLRFPEDYQNLYSVTGDVGVWASPVKNLSLGFHVFNLTFSKWNDAEKSPLPVVFSLGACYTIAETIDLLAEVSKDIYEAVRIKFATEFVLANVLYLRAGFISEPFEVHFGLGYEYKKFQFDVAMFRHPTLGYSPQGGVSMKF